MTKTIQDNEKRVCLALWQALDKAHPRLPIERWLTDHLEMLRDQLISEDLIGMPYGAWPDLFEGMRWRSLANTDYPRAGKQLLIFVGYLGEAVWHGEVGVIPRLVAIRVMHGLEGPWQNWLDYRQRGGRWELGTTRAGAAALGGSACFPIEDEPLTYDIPSQHFDALLKPWPLDV